ncbi:MAG: NAD(P)-dependent glycerol-3-phosphate dehydrogenase [Chloroflexi bacterium]|nr:NAD(P)-dependent glycerol-3-phosphate dehydrogenase [Chloroflexota bacterium]
MSQAKISELPRLAVIGTGSWGTTLAVVLAQKGLPVTLWARSDDEAARLQSARENVDFVPGLKFPAELFITAALDRALDRCALALIVVPAQTLRENVRRAREFFPRDTIILSCSKGLEIGTTRRMSEVIAEELPAHANQVAVMSGPHLHREIANGLPAAGVVASRNADAARFVQGVMNLPRFRLYTHDDVIGVELAGALKNIIAIAAGAVDGFGYGENTKATVLTRGLAEIARLAVAAGANPLTLAGLAGMGDLIATCASRLSRNHQVGERLARGETIDAIRASMKMVAEGVPTAKAALQMAQPLGIELPITEQVHAITYENKDLRQAVMDLMTRAAKPEMG